MKKIIYCLIIIPVFSAAVFSQEIIKNADGSYFKQCIGFEITKSLRELSAEARANKKAETAWFSAPDLDEIDSLPAISSETQPIQIDAVMQTLQGQKTSSGTLANFDGLTNNVRSPFDPSGAAGPNHFMQAINAEYAVFDKTGKTLMASTPLNALWPGTDAFCDPVVLYDKFADRWFISQLNWNSAKTQPNKLLIAISTSPDPTGTYYAYTFTPDVNSGSDSPKYNIWSDGYYQTCNCHDHYEVMVYDRTKMLAGDKTAGVIVKDYTNDISHTDVKFPGAPHYFGNHGTMFLNMMLTADGVLPPYGSPNYIYFYNDDNWNYGGTDEIIIYKLSVDWNAKSATMTLDNTLPVQAFNSVFPINGTSPLDGVTPFQGLDQPGKPHSLHALDGHFNFRTPYLRFTDHNAMVCCHIVNVGTSSAPLAAIRWYELRQDLNTNVWSIYQQGTYAPNDATNRWVPSIAMDTYGNIGLAYCVSNKTNVYPGIRYTGRSAGDPLGQMTFAETTAIAGSSSFVLDYRWGDYCQTTLDPDGITFWHSNMYMKTGGIRGTRIFSFQIGSATGMTETKTIVPEVVTYQSDAGLYFKATQLPSNENVMIDLFTSEGKKITGISLISNSGEVETTFNSSVLAAGIYLVRVGNSGFQKVVKAFVQ